MNSINFLSFLRITLIYFYSFFVFSFFPSCFFCGILLHRSCFENESGDRATQRENVQKTKSEKFVEIQAHLTTTLINAREIPPTNCMNTKSKSSRGSIKATASREFENYSIRTMWEDWEDEISVSHDGRAYVNDGSNNSYSP